MRTSHHTENNQNNSSKENRNTRSKRKVVPRHVQEKLAITVLVILLALFALCVVLYNIVKNNNEEYTRIVLSQHSTYDSRVIPYRRGDIVDRNGTYLATTEKVYNLILDPYQILDKEDYYLDTTVDALAQCFGYDKNDLKETITSHENSQYVRYERRLPYEKKEEFEALSEEINNNCYLEGSQNRVKGVWFEDEYKRIYPYDSLACTVLGFANSDGAGGNGGIEQYYNDTLIGTNGREYGYLNDDSNMETVIKSAQNGNTVVSTIDVNIQNLVEKRIEQWQEETGSEQIGVVVMDPNNGEILAMATDKSFDLNDPRDLSGLYTQEEQDQMTDEEKSDAWNRMWRNFCVSDTFEPGSPAKVFTVSAALEENLVNPNTHFFCDGYQIVANQMVKCTAYSKGGHGDLTLEETLINSCNDAMMQIAAIEKKEVFKKYQDLFNFGSKTGIDLPGEADASTLVYRVENMGSMDLATNSFGQNFNCTMVQLAAAFSSVINGGSYYEPHVVRQVLNENGSIVQKNDGVLVRETVSSSTSDFIKKALYRTVEEGTGTAAKVEGYEVGGKTGTAEKIPRKMGNYLVSFIGFAPADNPQVVVYVVIDEPHVDDQAHSTFASTVFSQIMGDILPYLNVFPVIDIPVEEETVEGLPQEEGITVGTEETVEEVPVKAEYDTEEYVPLEIDEDGSISSMNIPARLPDGTGGDEIDASIDYFEEDLTEADEEEDEDPDSVSETIEEFPEEVQDGN